MKRFMTATLTCSALLSTAMSPSVSSESKFIHEAVERNWDSMRLTRTIGRADLFQELDELARDCALPDWDGYGALPLTAGVIRETGRFLRSLTEGSIRPELSAEPDGQVAIEWHVSPKRTLSVSVSNSGELHYAALIGSSRHFGTVPFLGECPEIIADLIVRISQQ